MKSYIELTWLREGREKEIKGEETERKRGREKKEREVGGVSV